jgi:hypothetical protein
VSCRACGLWTSNRLCQFCRTTVGLIKAHRCVSCTEPINGHDTLRHEGRCAECRSRNVVVSAATRGLLILAARARWQQRWRDSQKALAG